MIRRPTWILLALFAVSLGAAWLWQRSQENKTSEGEPTATPAPRLLDLETDKVRDLQIEDAQGNRLFLRKLGTTWVMTEPERQNVDMEKVNGVVEPLVSAEVLNTLSTPPAQEQTGLGTPAYVLTLTDQEGKNYILEIGSETPTQSGYYVRKDGVVHVVGKFEIDSLVDLFKNPPVLPPTATSTGVLTPQGVLTGTMTVSPTIQVTATP